MTPEKQARVLIDQNLRDAGWAVQDANAINLSESLGVAVREFPLTSGFADYLQKDRRKPPRFLRKAASFRRLAPHGSPIGRHPGAPMRGAINGQSSFWISSPARPPKHFTHGPNPGRLPLRGGRPSLRRLLPVIARLWPQLLLADFTGKVVSVADGDTVAVLRGTEYVKVRFDGIAAPERKQPFGTKARLYLADLCFGKTTNVWENSEDFYGLTVQANELADGKSFHRNSPCLEFFAFNCQMTTATFPLESLPAASLGSSSSLIGIHKWQPVTRQT